MKRSNNSMQRTARRAAADAGRYVAFSLPRRLWQHQRHLEE